MARKARSDSDQLSLFATEKPAAAVPIPAAPPALPAGTRLAEIAVDGPVRGCFTYLSGDVGDLAPGARVEVPFGGRSLPGFFIRERTLDDLQKDGIDPSRLKAILKRLDGESGDALLTPPLLELAKWMARHYACPLGSTLSSMLPAGVKRGAAGARRRVVNALKSVDELLERAGKLLAGSPKQAAILMALAANVGPISAAALLDEADAPDSALKALHKAGLLRVTEERANNEGEAREHTEGGTTDLILNDEQQRALDEIEKAIESQRFAGFLLQGVTGSGKTEVYLRALKKALAAGKQAIVLVPEIALTPQTAQRFEQRLGRERVAVLHSHITDGDRAEAWREIRAGKIDVVVGARSALFAPLPRLGVIVVDEEHEGAFKQETTPRYHARDVALELARLSNAVLVLGSATPSFEALHLARTKTIGHLVLAARVAGRPMPPVEVIDLAQENRDVERYAYLSRRLLDAMDQTLARGEQTILFMNRRGFATVITCLRCGCTEKCEQCDIALTSHRAPASNPKRSAGNHSPSPPSAPAMHAGDQLLCHYCGYSKPVPDLCNGCGNPGVKHWGLGTERVENEVRKLFPTARLARMDSDTMNKRTAYLEALGNFRAGKIDVLIGTQMIAKGLDFPNVTLVGVVLADTALHMPDFRSRERTFQLLAQVAGRAGRGEKGGRVIVQTHLPNDLAVRAAAQHDFDSFSQQELQERRTFNYPPFSRLARILIRGKDLQITQAAAQAAAAALRAGIDKIKARDSHVQCSILGPADAPIARLESFHRQHIMIKASSAEVLADLLNGPAGDAVVKLKGAEATIDVDAIGML
jgi:primosomal protein N' (replication factor Y) (superfamily II helicase)